MAGYKINSSKSEAFLYTKDKQQAEKKWKWKEMEKPKNNIKYLGVTLPKQIKALYDRNFKSLKKEIHEDLRR